MIEPGKIRLSPVKTKSEMDEVVQYIYKVLDGCLSCNLDAVRSNINEICRQAGPSLLNGGEFEKAMKMLKKQHELTICAATNVFAALYEQTKIGKEQIE